MTTTTSTTSLSLGIDEGLEQTPAKHHPHRWRLSRAGIANVWFYYDAEFTFSGGRCIWRGGNGAGKSRALELLLPFLLDADRRKMDATGAGKVRLEDLMKAGSADQPNRLGYLWLELASQNQDGHTEHLTLGALVRFSRSTSEAKVWYFTTELRVGQDLLLIDSAREALSRDKLADLIGADRITDKPDEHRDRVSRDVFGLTGVSGRERFNGLLQLLRTLRSPDVGNRIEEGRLPSILSEALPPLSDTALDAAGEQLDTLGDTREAQHRLDEAHKQVSAFLDVYRRYAAGVLEAASQEAATAASGHRKALANVAQTVKEHTELVERHAKAEGQVMGREADQKRVEAAVQGIRGSKRYASVTDLDEKTQTAAALATAADVSLKAAATRRSEEVDAVDEAGIQAHIIVEQAGEAHRTLAATQALLARAGVSHELPPWVTARTTAPASLRETVLLSRDIPAGSLDRPVPEALELEPADLESGGQRAQDAGHAAQSRARVAGSRSTEAEQLDVQERSVSEAESRAEEAEARASRFDLLAGEAAESRDRTAVQYAQDWCSWAADDRTRRLLGDPTWVGTPLALLQQDVAALTGEDGVSAVLTALDHAADDEAGPARDRLSDGLAKLKQARELSEARRAVLLAEAVSLDAEHDPDPPSAPGHTNDPEGAVPLWRALDFNDGLTDSARAGIEGALLASGLLTASLTADGSLTATDGQVLLDLTGARAVHSLSVVLHPDLAAGTDPHQVMALLDRVSLDDASHPVWVGQDGSWGNGPLLGRYHPPVARHIGTTARAAARAVRLEEIDAELDELSAAAAIRTTDAKKLEDERTELKAHVRTAPRSSALAIARATAKSAATRALSESETARAERAHAVKVRFAWTSAVATHRAACERAGLPHKRFDLDKIRDDSKKAHTRCLDVARAFRGLGELVTRHARIVAKCEGLSSERAQVESEAERAWEEWHEADAILRTLRENVGQDAEKVQQELQGAEEELKRAGKLLKAARELEHDLTKEAARSEGTVHAFRGRLDQTQGALNLAGQRLLERIALPGVAQAATGGNPIEIELAGMTAEEVAAAARVVGTALDRRAGPVDENVLMKAQQALERNLVGTYDVIASVTDQVRTFELVDAAGQRHLAQAAAELARSAEEGRLALSERERQVFTNFVVGGVAEELGSCLKRAKVLIDDINKSLAGIKTSHGIGVRIRWTLTDPAGSPQARIRDLVATSADVRTDPQNAELTELIKEQVRVEFEADPTAGYATHLKAAMDYRTWHSVEVLILGPAPGQERRINRRAKLSQGETRFVSYVTLFAAVDAYLSSLPDTTHALRLLLLDDAFAKVDDRTIAELMGLLVRLDIDFAMTGHALWGCYPQVPALDVYEVRRGANTAAITTHVHWDGRSRHLQVAR